MKITNRARAWGVTVLLGFASVASLSHAGEPSTCDDIASDVRNAVAKDPAKVLMIVEDALVINESCACEIVKAAITAAKADKVTVQQIVQTALAVAPRMSAVITECAAAVAPDAGDAIATASTRKAEGKPDGKNPVSPVVPPEKVEGTDFGGEWATNIRGIYLVQPAASGLVTETVETSDTETKSGKSGSSSKQEETTSKSISRRTRHVVPLSPAVAQP